MVQIHRDNSRTIPATSRFPSISNCEAEGNVGDMQRLVKCKVAWAERERRCSVVVA